MKRRSFLRACAMSPIVALLPQKAKTEQADVPFIPTLEFLQEHNKNIVVCTIEYSTRGHWTCDVFRKTNARTYLKDKNRPKYETIFDWPCMAFLYWENGEWFAIDKQYREESGRLCYRNKIEWPNWLRRF